VAWEAGLPHKTSSPATQRWNGRAFSSLTARGGGLPVGVKKEKERIKRESLFSYDNIYVGENRPGWGDLREEILLRDGPICARCKNIFNPWEVQVDHIKMRARFKNPEDADRMENMQVLCTDCHRAKTKTDLKVLSRVR
jgi:5-methylcytosine-specific restriction endonuclease McrA